ncbi:MAG TPA: hypothetical protein ENK91_09325 [Bacteroidetes bacterium]|nr:hypothetical protein [Bacteroidota bacterium]
MSNNTNNKIVCISKIICLAGIVFLISTVNLFSQSKSNNIWVPVPSPIYSDLHSIQLFSDTSGIAVGDQVLVLKDNKWIEMKDQPPVKITSIFAIDTNSIFAWSKNSFQESELYYWNGKKWEEINHPLVNYIFSMNFIDRSYGVICGCGEVAVFENNKWKFFPPVMNIAIKNILITKDSTFWILSENNKLFKYKDKWKQINITDPILQIDIFDDNIYLISDDFFGKIVLDTIQKISYNKKIENTVSFSIVKSKEIFTIGSNGLILHYFNGKWEQNRINTEDNLNSIFMLNSDDGWIVGDNGTILHYTNQPDSINNIKYWKGFKANTLNHNVKIVDDEYGVVTADFNLDGLVDIFTCGLFEANHLYINKGNNYFVDEHNKYKILNKKNRLNLGACAGDIDNDGYPDLYITCLNGTNTIYKNINGKYFVDYSSISSGIGNKEDRTNSAILGDIDNDGDLDLFIANEFSSNRLYLNNGAGIFDEVTKKAGLISKYGGIGCSFGDIDNDGDLDLYIANWYGENKLYKNLLKESGNLQFQDISHKANVQGDIYTKSNAVVFTDIDNDADLDLFVSNRKHSNKLYINNGFGIFSDKTNELLGIDSFKTNGVLIADFDGNGYKDIYLSNVGKNVYYKNNGSKFVIQSSKYNTDIAGYSTGSAYADFDNDGDLDIYVANYLGESSTFLINKLNNRNFMKLDFQCSKINKQGIGSKVYVFKNNGQNDISRLIDFREIAAGSGYCSMNEINPIIPIQDNEFVDIKIVSPLGEVKTFQHIKRGSKLIVSDVKGLSKQMILIEQFLLRQIFDPHRLYEMIKWIFILILIAFFIQYGYRRYDWSIYLTISIALLLFIIYFIQFHFLEYNIFLYSTVLPLISISGLIFLLYQYFERKHIKQFTITEKEQIKEKLSRDLHDNLASTISSIGIYLTLIGYNITDKDGKLKQLLQKSESLVGEAASSITDLIWTIKPKPETLSNLMTRINNNFAELLSGKNINYSTTYKIDTEKVLLKPVIKQNLYLILKEVLNNILKHAEAKNITIDIESEKSNIKITIKDDGIGFDYDKIKRKGHGLTNIRKRAEDMKSVLNIVSGVGKGTVYELIFQHKK